MRPRDSGRKAGGPRQQQGGAQRIHKRDPSDPTAQQHHRPCGLGWGAQRTPKQNGRPHKLPGRLREQEARWSEAVEEKPEAASAQASRSVGSCARQRDTGKGRPAAKRGTNHHGCWRAHSGTCAAGAAWSTGTDRAAGPEGHQCLGFLLLSPRGRPSPCLPYLSADAPPGWQGAQRRTGTEGSGCPT